MSTAQITAFGDDILRRAEERIKGVLQDVIDIRAVPPIDHATSWYIQGLQKGIDTSNAVINDLRRELRQAQLSLDLQDGTGHSCWW